MSADVILHYETMAALKRLAHPAAWADLCAWHRGRGFQNSFVYASFDHVIHGPRSFILMDAAAKQMLRTLGDPRLKDGGL